MLSFSIRREKLNKKTLKYKQEETQSQRRNALAPFVSVSQKEIVSHSPITREDVIIKGPSIRIIQLLINI